MTEHPDSFFQLMHDAIVDAQATEARKACRETAAEIWRIFGERFESFAELVDTEADQYRVLMDCAAQVVGYLVVLVTLKMETTERAKAWMDYCAERTADAFEGREDHDHG